MIDKRCLKIIYSDKQSSFNELLNKDSSVSIHIRNIQRLAIEMFKICERLAPPIMDNVLSFQGQLSRLYIKGVKVYHAWDEKYGTHCQKN